MDTWIPVPVGERRRWVQGVQDISAEARIDCFQLASTRGSLDGPWSYALFVHDPVHPGVVTAYFATLEPEAFESSISPLDGVSGIQLTPKEVRGLIALLEAQMDNLPENQAMAGIAFQLLNEEECKKFNIVLEPSQNVEHHFYRQARPHSEVYGSDISTILLFSKDLPHREDGLYAEIMLSLAEFTHHYEDIYFKVMQFANSELQNPDFYPFDYALPRIYLDRADIRDLIALFQRFLA